MATFFFFWRNSSIYIIIYSERETLILAYHQIIHFIKLVIILEGIIYRTISIVWTKDRENNNVDQFALIWNNDITI